VKRPIFYKGGSRGCATFGKVFHEGGFWHIGAFNEFTRKVGFHNIGGTLEKRENGAKRGFKKGGFVRVSRDH